MLIRGGVAPLDAKVCFLVGTTGQCGKEIKGHQKCEDLGYQKNAAKCMSEAKRERWVPGGGVCNGFYEKCICDETYYTLTGRESDAPKYTYKDQCSIGKKLYRYRICIAAYQYVTQEDSQVYSTSGMSADKYNSVTVCGTNMLLGSEQCVDTRDANSITRSKTCLCDTSTFPYTTVSDTTAFKLSNKCEDVGAGVTDSNKKHYKTVECSGTTSGGGTWKSSCTTNTEYYVSSESKTDRASSVTCKFCRPETCEHKYTSPQQYGSKRSCETNSGFNANTQKCVTGDKVGTTQCYKVVNKECSDHSTSYYKDRSNCESGMGNDKKCISDTVQGLTCYKRVAKTCTEDYNGYALADIPFGHKATLLNTGNSGLTCYTDAGCNNDIGLYSAPQFVMIGRNPSPFAKSSSKFSIGSTESDCYTIAGCNTNYSATVPNATIFNSTKHTKVKAVDPKKLQDIMKGAGRSQSDINKALIEFYNTLKTGTTTTVNQDCYEANGCKSPTYTTSGSGTPVEQTKTANGADLKCYNAPTCSVGDVMLNAFGSGSKSCVSVNNLASSTNLDSAGVIISEANNKYKTVALGFSALNSGVLSDPNPSKGNILISKAELSSTVKTQILSETEFRNAAQYLRNVKDKIMQLNNKKFQWYGPGWNITDLIFETKQVDESGCMGITVTSSFVNPTGSRYLLISGEQVIGAGIWTKDGKLCYTYGKTENSTIKYIINCDTVNSPTTTATSNDRQIYLSISVRDGTRRPTIDTDKWKKEGSFYSSNTTAPYYTNYTSVTNDTYSVSFPYSLRGTWVSGNLGVIHNSTYSAISIECGDEGELMSCWEVSDPKVGGDGSWRRSIYYTTTNSPAWGSWPTSSSLDNAIVDESFYNSILYDSSGKITSYNYKENESVGKIEEDVGSMKDEYGRDYTIYAGNTYIFDESNFAIAIGPSDAKCYKAGFREYYEYYKRAVHPRPQLGLIYKVKEINKSDM